MIHTKFHINKLASCDRVPRLINVWDKVKLRPFKTNNPYRTTIIWQNSIYLWKGKFESTTLCLQFIFPQAWDSQHEARMFQGDARLPNRGLGLLQNNSASQRWARSFHGGARGLSPKWTSLRMGPGPNICYEILSKIYMKSTNPFCATKMYINGGKMLHATEQEN